MNILSSADWHINLHKKKIPYEWQKNRYQGLFSKLLNLESKCDVHVISGDLFDKKPETDDVCLLLSYLNAVHIPTIVIPGNHEATSKGKTFWEHFKLDYAIKNDNVFVLTSNDRIEINGQGFQAFPYGSVQTDSVPKQVDKNDILITHIRGEVPPHITEEFDFERLRKWKLILLGDLHFNHRYKDFPAYYPGSPLNTTFDRDASRRYGVDIIYFRSSDDYDVEFVDLKLPKLIRKTVDSSKSIKEDNYDHVIYELTGTIDELSRVKNHELLDKKIADKPSEEAKLNLLDLTLVEELDKYLEYVQVSNKDQVIGEFNQLGIKE